MSIKIAIDFGSVLFYNHYHSKTTSEGGTTMNVQFKKGVLDLCVLSMLKESDQYGYELANTLSELIQISDGTVYPILRKLAMDGMVTTYLQESQSGPPRKYYKLTGLGRKTLTALLEEWLTFSRSVNQIVGGDGK